MICSSVNCAFICPAFCWADSTQIWRSFRGAGHTLNLRNILDGNNECVFARCFSNNCDVAWSALCKNWNFGTFFEAKVAHEIAEFASRFASNDLVLLATDAEGVAASLILDLNDPVSGQRGAHLRWFISADRCRGTGIGRSLMDSAVSHADKHADGHM